jgi:hypothetical protein
MLKKLTFLIIVFIAGNQLFAQDFRVTGFAGMANYNGDLQERNISFNQARYTFGAWLGYDINSRIMLRGGLHYASVGASDIYQTGELRRLRNLSFRTNIWELHGGAEFHFLGMDRVISPYIFGGAAGFRYNPFAFDPVGNKVFLKPLSTEGQGFPEYPDRKPYQLIQFAIPAGIGVRMNLNDRFDVGAEFGYRKTFTDYMDDVSLWYVDGATLLARRGPRAVQMAFRTPELPQHTTDPYPIDFEKRGSPTYKDNYYFFGLTLSYRLTDNNSLFKQNGGRKKRSNMGCPNNVL